jgi:hypothetical protein
VPVSDDAPLIRGMVSPDATINKERWHPIKDFWIRNSFSRWMRLNNKRHREKLAEIEKLKKICDDAKMFTDTLKVVEDKYKYKEFKKESKKRFFRKIIDFFTRPDDFLARIKLRNGEKIAIIVDTKKSYFMYKGGAYIVDFSKSEWDATARMYYSEYHEDISFPIHFNIPVIELKKKLEESAIKDIDLSANPYVLKKFIESEFIQKVAQGADAHQELSFIKTMVLISMIIILINSIMLISIMRK